MCLAIFDEVMYEVDLIQLEHLRVYQGTPGNFRGPMAKLNWESPCAQSARFISAIYISGRSPEAKDTWILTRGFPKKRISVGNKLSQVKFNMANALFLPSFNDNRALSTTNKYFALTLWGLLDLDALGQFAPLLSSENLS